MKRNTIVFSLLFAALFLGCQSPRIEGEPTKVQANQRNPRAHPYMIRVDVIELPDIISSVCNGLDIAVRQSGEESGRYTWSCKSLGNLDVEIEAMALVKGKSLVSIDVGGGNWGNDLKGEIRSALYAASANQQKN
jgi:hypothetical protein